MNAILNTREIDRAIPDINTIELTDSYKVTHWKQYPPGTRGVYSFFESRGGQFAQGCFFGLQYYLKKYLVGPVITRENVDEAAEDFELHFGTPAMYNRDGWKHILNAHGGRLPVQIRAVPEGTVVPTQNVLMTTESTDPAVPWATNYLETLLSMVWYPSTTATKSRAMRAILLSHLKKNGTPELIDFKLHDFGFRGSTSVESAGLGGMSHLINFKGTDTLQATRFARKYYYERMAGFSIPAAEHSTITSWGREHEGDALENLLDQYPTGLVAGVSDSYDIYAACERIWGTRLREKVLKRDGTVVVRPDSGNPPEVVVKVLDILGAKFGVIENDKGYKVLPPQIRIIQGDGIDLHMLALVLEAMDRARWSADNIAFGSGGGLLQNHNRDTMKFAYKCSAVDVDGTWHNVMKDPVTDPGKRSKAGRLALVRYGESFRTMLEDEAAAQGLTNELVPVFRNGELLLDQSFAEVRERALLN